MKIELEYINNGWIVYHDIGCWLGNKVFFKTLGQATAYMKKQIDKYKQLQE